MEPAEEERQKRESLANARRGHSFHHVQISGQEHRISHRGSIRLDSTARQIFHAETCLALAGANHQINPT